MESARYDMVRNAVIHAGLLMNIANKLLEDEVLTVEQDTELTLDMYCCARTAESVVDTLKETTLKETGTDAI